MSYNNLTLEDENTVLQRNTGIQLAIDAISCHTASISLATPLQKPHKLHQHLPSGETILEYNQQCNKN
jgi:hypothetical protein